MTIQLPQDVERSIEVAVNDGLFASVDEALAAAWRCLERQRIAPRGDPEPARHEEEPAVPPGRKPIWERVAELRDSIPAEEWDNVPTDGADQLDHYLYGSPRRPIA